MGPEGSLGVRDDLFSEYALDHCYDEMFDRPGVPREPYAALHRRLLELSPAERVMPMSTWVAPQVIEPPDAVDQEQQQQ